MLNLEHAVRMVLWISVAVLAVDALLVIFILGRRLRRWWYFRKKDAAGRQFSGPIHSFLAGDISADQLVANLRRARNRAQRDALRDLLVHSLEGATRKAVTQILFRLGYVETWTREAFGRRRAAQLIRHITAHDGLPPAKARRFRRIRRLRLFCIRRARAVTQLGHLDASFAEVFVREALHDPSPYVGRANIAAMGRNQQGYEVPVLLELLRKIIQGTNDLPVSSVKASLARYPISHLDRFVPFLNVPDSHYRFILVDSIREICDGAKFALEGRDFPENLYQWFLKQGAQDESIDVRARSARVIGHFHDHAAAVALRAMMLDANEFVRLHAVRACDDPYYSELAGDVARRIVDPKWRVREASVKTLAALGKAGRQHLADFFLNTTDRFASEQIAEEMQRIGIIADMLPALGGENGETDLAVKVCAKMVQMGKTSLLTDLLAHETRLHRWTDVMSTEPVTKSAQRAKMRLLDLLLQSPTPELMSTVRSLAEHKDDSLGAKAQAVLDSQEEAAAASIGRKTHA